jgi:large subunit ribosomal protein L11
MPGKDIIELLVDGGKAGPDQTSSQRLGAYKLNIGDVFKKVNEKTAIYKGMQVPVKIIVDKDTKAVDIEVGVPPVASMIKKELGIEKAKVTEEDIAAGKNVLGSITVEQCVKIAKLKMGQMLVKDMKSAVKQVVGTAGSLTGVLVEGKNYKEVMKEIEDGKWDDLLKG